MPREAGIQTIQLIQEAMRQDTPVQEYEFSSEQVKDLGSMHISDWEPFVGDKSAELICGAFSKNDQAGVAELQKALGIELSMSQKSTNL